MNGFNRRPAGGNGGGRKSSRYGGFKKPRFGRGASGGGKSPGGFGMSRRGRKFKSRAGDDRRGRAGGGGGGYGSRASYEDGFQAGVAHAQRIGYRF